MRPKDPFAQLIAVLTEVKSSLQFHEGLGLDDATILVSFVCSTCNDNGILTHFIDSRMQCPPPPHTFLAARQLECVL